MLKGIVQRKPRWFKISINLQIMLGARHSFLILKGYHIEICKKTFCCHLNRQLLVIWEKISEVLKIIYIALTNLQKYCISANGNVQFLRITFSTVLTSSRAVVSLMPPRWTPARLYSPLGWNSCSSMFMSYRYLHTAINKVCLDTCNQESWKKKTTTQIQVPGDSYTDLQQMSISVKLGRWTE
jgi:hypothetical protein